MPSAPLSSARVAIEYCPFGTRASGAIPASSAAAEICAQASSDIVPCSMSRNSQSNPAVAIIFAISTLRVVRIPTPRDNCPCSSFSRATFRTDMVVSFLCVAVDRGSNQPVQCRHIHRMVGLIRHRDGQPMAAQDEDLLV